MLYLSILLCHGLVYICLYFFIYIFFLNLLKIGLCFEIQLKCVCVLWLPLVNLTVFFCSVSSLCRLVLHAMCFKDTRKSAKPNHQRLLSARRGTWNPLSLSLFHTHTYTHLISLQFIIISISRVIILSIYSGKIRNNI